MGTCSDASAFGCLNLAFLLLFFCAGLFRVYMGSAVSEDEEKKKDQGCAAAPLPETGGLPEEVEQCSV